MYPDVIDLLRDYLLPVVSPRQVASRIPDPRPDEWVQLRRVGGVQRRPVRDAPNVDVFCWALTDPAAWELADLVRRSIHSLAGTATLGLVVYRVQEMLGPTSTDDPLTGTPRVWATYTIDVRADDAIAR